MADKKVYNTMADLSEKSRATLNFLRQNDNGAEGFFGTEIATACEINPQGIHGVMNVLVKIGLVSKGSKDAEFVSKDGTKGTKPYTTYILTDAGRAFPDAE